MPVEVGVSFSNGWYAVGFGSGFVKFFSRRSLGLPLTGEGFNGEAAPCRWERVAGNCTTELF